MTPIRCHLGLHTGIGKARLSLVTRGTELRPRATEWACPFSQDALTPEPTTLKGSERRHGVQWATGTLLGIVEETQGQKAQVGSEINLTWPWGRRGKPLPTEAVSFRGWSCFS